VCLSFRCECLKRARQLIACDYVVCEATASVTNSLTLSFITKRCSSAVSAIDKKPIDYHCYYYNKTCYPVIVLAFEFRMQVWLHFTEYRVSITSEDNNNNNIHRLYKVIDQKSKGKGLGPFIINIRPCIFFKQLCADNEKMNRYGPNLPDYCTFESHKKKLSGVLTNINANKCAVQIMT
jgi:hypothetical protein